MNTQTPIRLLTVAFLFFLGSLSAANADDLQDAKDAFKSKAYETAYKLFLPLAKQGNADAQNYLGLMHYKGQWVPQDNQEAIRLFRLAAEQGLIEAQFNLGVTYSNGQGVFQDDKEAVKWFQLAADQGDVASQERLDFFLKEKVKENNQKDNQDFQNSPGKVLAGDIQKDSQNFQNSPEKVPADDTQEEDADDSYVEKSYKKKYKLTLPLAKKGDAEAQYNLGVMYDNGLGVLRDYKEALYWYRLATEQGYAKGKIEMYNLAKKNVPQALSILINDAENRVAEAQNKLGEVYSEGKGLPQDYVLAHMWFNLAGSQVNENAIRNRNALERKMSPSQIEKAQELARNWQKSIWEQLKERMGLERLKAIFKKF